MGVELANVTGGRPQHWRTADRIDKALGLDHGASNAAIAFAVAREWLLTEGQPPHSICLTDGGRIMAQQRARR